MLEKLREEVYKANIALPTHGLVVFTWGNASGFDPDSDLFVIKPSGVAYEELTPSNLVVCDLDGNVVEGDLNPSSDTPTHAVLYKAWGDRIQGVVHTHSSWATSWAQAGKSIPCYGTTQADYFYGDIPCMRSLSQTEIKGAYEAETGNVIVDGFAEKTSTPSLFQVASSETMASLVGEPTPMKPPIMPSLWKRAQRWRCIQNRSIRM